MNVIKRDSTEVGFNRTKIVNAIMKSMKNGSGIIKEKIANDIADEIYEENKDKTELSVYEIEELVFNKLIAKKQKITARAYEGYRSVREFQRENENTIDLQTEELLKGDSDYWNNENSNKNPRLLTTQRDYMAGIVSTDITRRFLLPPDIVQAHDEGLIHFHDADYFAQNAISNCCLINLEDMLQNGTCINKIKIETPKTLRTAATIATQIITAVASSQYGGCTITLSHLAPFVRKSKERYLQKYRNRNFSEEDVLKYAEEDLKKEIEDSVQTFNYQCLSMTTTNGQTPFLSVCMYLGESEEYKEEIAMLIEEFLNQRIQGMKNEVGVFVTQAFPKLLYVLEEDNIREDSKYWHLTELAAKCTAKRMVPDYISEKIMKELKEGNCYPCMGCVEGNEVVTYRFKNNIYVESFIRMWDRLSRNFKVNHQYSQDNPNLFMDLEGVEIFDTINGFVNTNRIIRNYSNNWVKVKMSNGRILICTDDHPFTTDHGDLYAKDLVKGYKIKINHSQVVGESCYNWDKDIAWVYGLLLCDGSFSCYPFGSFAIKDEDDIIDKLKSTVDKHYCINSKIKEHHRGEKGNYKDVYMHSKKLQYDLINYFEGINKENRHIPNILFSMDYDVRLSFLAGMIDADGYVNSNMKLNKVQMGSTNKELSLQQLALIQSLGMPAYVFENHYNKKHPEKIRYRIEFVPTKDLIDVLVCKKKKDKFVNNIRSNASKSILQESEIISVEYLDKVDYSYDVTTESGHFEVSGIYSHNCRSFLTPYIDKDGNYRYYGRFNQGVVTLNLVDIALSSNKDMDTFWNIFDERLDLAHRALRIRHERLKGTTSDVAPILWQDGAFARLEKGELIDPLLYNGYSTISLGYGGLYETVKYMTNHSHTEDGIGKEFGLKVMQYMNDACKKWKEEENIDYSLYGSPLESGVYKFAKCLKKRFGDDIFIKIDGYDKDYITNSYHVNVREEINAFDKLKIESEFQKLSPGGAISYIETSDLSNNTEAIIQVMQFIYDNIMYAELNTKSDYCQVCGYDKEIKVIDEGNELIWECPNCKNRDKNKMNVARRTCGYIGTQFWNQGRTEDIRDRYVHLDDIERECD